MLQTPASLTSAVPQLSTILVREAGIDYQRRPSSKEKANENSEQWYNLIAATRWKKSDKATQLKNYQAYHTDEVKVIEESSEWYGSVSVVILPAEESLY